VGTGWEKSMIDEMNYSSGGYCANLFPLWYFCLLPKVGKTGEPRDSWKKVIGLTAKDK
jgi:hypothetical protein